MNWKMTFLAAPALAIATFAALPATGVTGAAQAACDPGDRIDGSTAGWAAGKAKEAGYTNVRMERKGCDNYWHGVGSKDGQTGRFVVSPEGDVMPEGD